MCGEKMGTMISIHEILGDDIGWCELKFHKYKNPFLINEHYCINPICDCQSVRITFLLLNDEDEIDGKVIGFNLNLKTYKTTDIDIYNPSFDFAYLISEFTHNLSKFVGSYKENYKIAKDYGTKNNNKHVLKDDIKETVKKGLTVGYSELFEVKKPLRFNIDGKQYLMEDHYCIDPKCECHQVIVHFILDHPKENDYQHLFSIHYSLRDNKYSFSNDEQCSEEYENLVNYVFNKRSDLDDLFKSRYKAVKEQGKRYIKERNQPVKSNKVGRNEPCPCGSSKKYKNCCGK